MSTIEFGKRRFDLGTIAGATVTAIVVTQFAKMLFTLSRRAEAPSTTARRSGAEMRPNRG
jgi:hypothetical protein